MLLDFNPAKAIAATAYLIEKDGGQDDLFPLVKKLYYADRTALIEWGDSITGSALASLEKGPIVSTIYDLLKGTGKEEDQIRWNESIERRQPYAIVLRKSPDKGVLSEREIETLEKARVTIKCNSGKHS